LKRSARTSSAKPEALIRSARAPPERRGGDWPWTIPAPAHFEELPPAAEVTFLVGENGTGKTPATSR
jgi:predicted ATPase